MAIKTRQNKVINAMLPYIANIDNGQQKALALWDAIDELPVKAPYPFKFLIDVIRQEPFLNGHKGKLSDATELALKAFKDSVNPQEGIALQDDYDVLGHLISAFKAYEKHFDLFNNWDQRDLYAVQVIGELQSVLYREDAEVHCHGFYNVVEKNEEPNSDRARDLKLQGGERFYRAGSSSGLGVDFMCGAFGSTPVSSRWRGYSVIVNKLLQQTQISSASLKAGLAVAAGQSQSQSLERPMGV